MKKYLFIFAAAATCMLVACSKEKELRAPEAETEETTASEFVRLPGWTYIGASNVESKASLTDDSTPVFKWNTGDKIALFTDNDGYLVSDALDASFNNEESATFGFEGTGINPHRSCFAVYPASLVSGCANPTENSLAINLPASYTLAQVQDLVSPIPMVALNDPNQPLAFKSICALLRITVKNVAWDAQSIKIRFPGKKVNGSFTLSSFVPGEGGVAGAVSSSEAEETITITDLNLNDTYTAQLVVNIPVPMGTYDYVVTGAYDASGLVINWINTPVKADGSTGEPLTWSPGRRSRRTLTADLPMFTVWGSKLTSATTVIAGDDAVKVPYGYIGKSDRKTIVFAPGNLQASLQVLPLPNSSDPDNASIVNYGTAAEWRFADHQYDAIGATVPEGRTYSYNSLQNPEVGDWIDLFSWMGSDATSSDIITKSEEYKYGVSYPCNSGTTSYQGNGVSGSLWYDWGKNIINYNGGSYNSNAWRTPTELEMMVLLSRRYAGTSGANGIDIACKAQIKFSETQKICGLIILPDNFSIPYGVHAISKVHKGNSTKWKVADGQSVCADNEYSPAEWEKLEGAGCVFLPLTNCRRYDTNNDIATTVYPADGWYWTSSTRTGRYVNALAFNNLDSGTSAYNNKDDNLSANQQADRHYGYAVRLVRYVKPE